MSILSSQSQDTLRQDRAKKRVSMVSKASCQTENFRGIGETQNVSETGVMVSAQGTLPPGSEVKVRFFLPRNTQAVEVEATGKVVWAVWGMFMGIQFLDMKEECREAIARFVEETPSSQN